MAMLNRPLDARLPMPRIWIHGTQSRRVLTASWNRDLWIYDFADDVRELVVRTEIRPGVIAEWTDPRDWGQR